MNQYYYLLVIIIYQPAFLFHLLDLTHMPRDWNYI